MSLTPPHDSSSRTVSVPVELDADGFLRRACPHCEREFKWLPSDDSEAMEPGGYHCPYCNAQADADAWFTKPQVDYLAAVGMKEFVEPLLDDLQRSVEGMNRSGGMIQARLDRGRPPQVVKPHEPSDMRRVNFGCHVKEPVKVVDDWTGPVHCLICGAAA